MKTGDLVIYIGDYNEELTLHKQYTIKTILMSMTYGRYTTYYDVINDNGLLRHYEENKFVSVKKFRDIKISKLLSE
jgi:hypothetical protein